jgi:hypothetical protein
MGDFFMAVSVFSAELSILNGSCRPMVPGITASVMVLALALVSALVSVSVLGWAKGWARSLALARERVSRSEPALLPALPWEWPSGWVSPRPLSQTWVC